MAYAVGNATAKSPMLSGGRGILLLWLSLQRCLRRAQQPRMRRGRKVLTRTLATTPHP